MKNEFPWAMPHTEEEINSIWEQGLLVLDANVLLDLYRCHEDTRDELLNAISYFDKRVWLTHQAAEEFFLNRKKVIISAKSSFASAKTETDEFMNTQAKFIKTLRSNKIIPDDIVEDLDGKLSSALDDAQNRIKSAEESFPNYSVNDLIFEKLWKLLNGSIGQELSSDDLKCEQKEAERRIENKIPPGYADAEKNGDKSYGDYLMWKQMLIHIKQEKKPLIFVTSDGKEDWWEKASGQTVGLRSELLREFHTYTGCGNKFLSYSTSRFVVYAAEKRTKTGKKVDKEKVSRAVSEIENLISIDAPTVRIIAQQMYIAERNQSVGRLHVEILRSTPTFTCSGHFDPTMYDSPKIDVKIVEHPEYLPEYRISAGTGTNFDFNIHLRSITRGEYLPKGKYTFEYKASTPEIESNFNYNS